MTYIEEMLAELNSGDDIAEVFNMIDVDNSGEVYIVIFRSVDTNLEAVRYALITMTEKTVISCGVNWWDIYDYLRNNASEF